MKICNKLDILAEIRKCLYSEARAPLIFTREFKADGELFEGYVACLATTPAATKVWIEHGIDESLTELDAAAIEYIEISSR